MFELDLTRESAISFPKISMCSGKTEMEKNLKFSDKGEEQI